MKPFEVWIRHILTVIVAAQNQAQSQSKNKQERQKKNNTEVRQSTKPQVMEFNSRDMERPISFYLSSLEEQCQCEVNDDEARLTQSATEGRVLLDIREDLLDHFFVMLQKQRENVEWNHEK